MSDQHFDPEEWSRDVDEIAGIIEGDYIDKIRLPVPDDGKRFTVTELVTKLLDEFLIHYNIKTFKTTNDEVIGVFVKENKSWKPAELWLETMLEKCYTALYDQGYKLPSYTTIKNEFVNRLKARTYQTIESEPLNVAFKNCIFSWYRFLYENRPIYDSVLEDADELVFNKIPHTLLYNIPIELTVEKIEEAAKVLCPKTLEAFKAWVGDKWILLFELIGYCLYPSYDLHKAVMLVGSGSNGKSTFLRLVKDILGPYNVTGIPLQQLISNRFAISKLYHKLANIFADLPSQALDDTGLFKALTGEDVVDADRKYKDAITFVNYAKLLFSANELPRPKDMTDAFWRRWLIIEFPNKFKPNPRFYEETFTKSEIEGIIVVAIHAFKRVWLRGKFSFEETEADYREQWLMRSDSVYAWLKTGIRERWIIESPEVAEYFEDLYESYSQFCDEMGLSKRPRNIFSMRLRELGYQGVRVHGKLKFKGLKLLGNEIEEENLKKLLEGEKERSEEHSKGSDSSFDLDSFLADD